MRDGVASSLARDKVEPCLLDGRDPPGVTLDRTGIEVLNDLDGVRLSELNKLSLSESVRDFDDRSCVCSKNLFKLVSIQITGRSRSRSLYIPNRLLNDSVIHLFWVHAVVFLWGLQFSVPDWS